MARSNSVRAGPWLLCVLAYLACWIADGELARGENAAGGTLLRQLTSADGALTNLNSWESLSLPQSVTDRRASLSDFQNHATPAAAFADAGAKPAQWETPYAMGEQMAIEESPGGWQSFLPEGCLPWGPRTPPHARHIELGCPLEGTSWRNRPLSAGLGFGILVGDDPIDHHASLEPAFQGFYRLGWDYDYYWGFETRLGLSAAGVTDSLYSTDITQWDVDIMYYPWGDSRWRPYLSYGLGLQAFDMYDSTSIYHHETLFSMPFGVGLKWLCTPWFAFRFEVLDNVTFGGKRLDSMHNFSINGGVEVRFGGTRKSYWPWNPSRQLW